MDKFLREPYFPVLQVPSVPPPLAVGVDLLSHYIVPTSLIVAEHDHTV